MESPLSAGRSAQITHSEALKSGLWSLCGSLGATGAVNKPEMLPFGLISVLFVL